MNVHKTQQTADERANDRLTEFVASRLCHDLVSPIGAVGNGLELLQLSGQHPRLGSSEEMQLIEESLAAARTRIDFYRIAFGHASRDQRVPAEQIEKLLRALQTPRLTITCNLQDDLTRLNARLILLAALCLEKCLAHGGDIRLSRIGAGWSISAESDQIKHDPILWAWLDGTTSQPDMPAASAVQFPLLADVATRHSVPISIKTDDRSAEISF